MSESGKKRKMFSVFNFSKKQNIDIASEIIEHSNLPSSSITSRAICQENQSLSFQNKQVLDTELLTLHQSQQQHVYDIASFVVNHALKPSEIENCLKNAWRPSSNYAFPQKIEGNGKNQRNRKFLYKYLELFPWLAYSEMESGAFCKWCVVFAFSGGGIGRQKLGKLVTQPLIKYKDAMTDFQEHATKDYHLLASQRVKDFLTNCNDGGEKSVDVLLNNHLKKVIEHNHKRLLPIIKTIIFCAQNNLALRGVAATHNHKNI